jgi:hypothetical protein
LILRVYVFAGFVSSLQAVSDDPNIRDVIAIDKPYRLIVFSVAGRLFGASLCSWVGSRIRERSHRWV